VARLREALGVEVRVRAVFEHPTVAALAAHVATLRRDPDPGPPLVSIARTDRLPVSFAQERLWFLEQLAPGAAYHCPAAVRLTGALEVPALAAAWTAVIARHEGLRTTFVADGGVPFAVITPPASIPLVEDDACDLSDAALTTRLAADAAAPFDLTRGPLWRLRLWRTGEATWVLAVTLHHAVCDGWSVGVLVRDLATAYAAARRGRAPEWLPLPVQVVDYAAWQRATVTGATRTRLLVYWRQQLAGAPPRLTLPTDHARPAARTTAGASVRLALGAPLSAQLAALARAEGITLYMVLVAAWAVVLSRASGQRDLVLGTAVAGREPAGLDDLVGCFINLLPLRVRLAPATRFRALVRQVRETTLDALAHQALPFEQLVDDLQPPRESGEHPIFQVAFGVLNVPTTPLELPDVRLELLAAGDTAVRYDLTLWVEESRDDLICRWTYAASLFDRAAIADLHRQYVDVLALVVAAPDAPVCQWTSTSSSTDTASPASDLRRIRRRRHSTNSSARAD
jgi:hypothetical protein